MKWILTIFIIGSITAKPSFDTQEQALDNPAPTQAETFIELLHTPTPVWTETPLVTATPTSTEITSSSTPTYTAIIPTHKPTKTPKLKPTKKAKESEPTPTPSPEQKGE